MAAPRPGDLKWVESTTTKQELENQVGAINTTPAPLNILVGVSGFFAGLANAVAGTVIGAFGLILLAKDTYYNEQKAKLESLLSKLTTASPSTVVVIEQEYKYSAKGAWAPTNNVRFSTK
ncbi:hypothetical protein HNQ80_004887 [Anaerosolibacter carboniphilus]|uniref:Uncharacterized protein n=1 Tax=Anaerosolibacter carboniphilus TaxID=1417629 RepID=A0A841L6J7_9FIRM|nr:hypothetical protein [Anaerosolibacter carboniphilus]MBB6218712.1 hypothetical protein [Anaerosolibacter carboniphilus]